MTKEYLRPIPKNTIVLFSSGAYSDYMVHGLMKALVDIDPDAIRDEYVSEFPEEMGNYSFHSGRFIQWLKDKNLFEDVPGPRWMEWYLQSYSRISEMKVYDGPILFD